MKGKFIKESALATAVSLVLLLFREVPLLGVAFIFLSVTPQMVLFCRGRKGAAFLSWASLMAVLYVLAGSLAIGLYFALFHLYALWYLKVLSIETRPANRIILAAAGWVVLAAAVMGSVAFLTEINPLENIFLSFRSSAGNLKAVYIDAGMPQMGIIMHRALDFILKGFAGLVGVLSLVGSWLIYLIVSRYSSLKAEIVPEKFRLPEEMIWVFLAAGAFFILGNRVTGLLVIEMTGINLGVFFLSLYFASGLAVAFFIMEKWNIKRYMRSFLVFFLILFGGGVYLFTAIGIADVWLDLRKKVIKGKSKV